MKKIITLAAAALFSLSLAGVSFAADPAQAPAAKASTKKPSVKKERTINETATVEAVDQTTRVITLKGPKGKVFDIVAGEEVRNLAQLKAGDKVSVSYYQSIAVDVKAPGKSTADPVVAVAAERANPGEKPGGSIGGSVTVTAKVETIDTKKQLVTLKGPEGKIREVKVKDPKNLENVKVGDDVVITVTEALAISVKAAKK